MFDYSTIPSGYYDHIFRRGRGPQSKWHHIKFCIFQELLKGRIAHLDIGCGPGTLIGLLPGGFKSIGVDLAEEQVAYAKRAYAAESKTFLQVGGYPYPFPDASFDCITVIELIEHLPLDEAEAILREAFRLLTPGGVVVVSTPNYASCWPVLEKIVNRLAPVSYQHQHITRFTSHTLVSLLRSAGFGAVQCRAYQGFAFLAAAFNWRLADLVDIAERHITWRRYGLLLLTMGTKRPCP
jgi:SAM-dependent methyltransferase